MYSAVTAAMARLGRLEEWLAATAANPDGSQVRFSSCFPFQRKTMFVVPPQSVWPPPASAKIRYKGARFVPLQLVASLLADQPVDETRWLLDGASECLLPSDRNEGPFRATLRSSAVVDRLTPGACDVHTTACLEFAPGCGLWFLVGFASREARERWAGPVKTALRLLADTGFGGERSQGWGRSEMPEFVDGDLAGFVLPPRKPKPPRAAVIATPPVAELDSPREGAEEPAGPPASEVVPEPGEDAGETETAETPVEPPAPLEEPAPIAAEPTAEGQIAEAENEGFPPVTKEPVAEPSVPPDETVPVAAVAVPDAEVGAPAPATKEPVAEEPPAEEPAEQEPTAESEPSDELAADEPIPAQQAWWMLSLFTPNASDQVDWTRGKYALVVRSGRVESASRHGDLKTPANMIQEGSVLVSDTEPRGGARNVAPESFPHPVYRAGFAVAIPIPLRVTP
jgi:CRISPR/Cas system CSM-associated protein Csm4 (group 5 of RAMP superfamily)